jgi:hypothetical protein
LVAILEGDGHDVLVAVGEVDLLAEGEYAASDLLTDIRMPPDHCGATACLIRDPGHPSRKGIMEQSAYIAEAYVADLFESAPVVGSPATSY